jgi:hypothetical protein
MYIFKKYISPTVFNENKNVAELINEGRAHLKEINSTVCS